MKMLNFAHGELYMIGGSPLFVLLFFGVHPFWGILLAMLIAFALGVLMERTILHPLLDKPGWDVSPIVATLGVSIFLQNFALKVWGERFKNVPYFIEGTLDLSGFRIAYQRILILVVAAAVMVVFWLYVKRSRFGMALRATAQDRDAATILGVNSHRIYLMTFGISSALAALAATMLAPFSWSIPGWAIRPCESFHRGGPGWAGEFRGSDPRGLSAGLHRKPGHRLPLFGVERRGRFPGTHRIPGVQTRGFFRDERMVNPSHHKGTEAATKRNHPFPRRGQDETQISYWQKTYPLPREERMNTEYNGIYHPLDGEGRLRVISVRLRKNEGVR
jgi:branched-chain amino acid transport system permease protein